MDNQIQELTESQLQQIEEKIDRYFPYPKKWACASAKMNFFRQRELTRKRLIVEEKEKMEMRKQIYNDDLAA